MPEVLGMIQLVERLQQDFRSVVNETKRKYIPIKDSAEVQIKKLKELVNGKDDIRSYIISNNVEVVEPFIKGCETFQPKLINVCLTALQRLITSHLMSEASVESLLRVLRSLVDLELEELRLLQTTILLVTTCQSMNDVTLSQAIEICLLLYDSKTNAVVNTAAAAIRQCTSAIFDQVMKEGPASSSSENAEESEKSDVFKFTPTSKSAFFLFQDLCLLTTGDLPHWLRDIETISPLLGLELIESVLLNYSDLFGREKEFNYLLKERVCPLMIKLLTSGLPADAQRNATLTATTEASGMDGASGGNTYAGPADFGTNVRLNRIINLLCSKYFHCLNTECEMLISIMMRIVENEQNVWRRALALEVVFKIALQPDLLMSICSTFDLMKLPSRVFLNLVATVCSFIQASLLTPHDSRWEPTGASSGGSLPQKPSFIYRGVSHVIADAPKFSLLETLDRHEAPVLPEGYSLRITISCLLQFVWSMQQLIQKTASTPEGQSCETTPIPFEMLKISWTAILPALSLLLEACSEEKLTDSLLTAVSVMVVLSSRCCINDARESFVATICKFALPSLSALTEKQSGKHQQGGANEATDRSPIVIVVNANHGLGSLSLEVSPSASSNGTGGGAADTGSGQGPAPSSSLFITAKHIQISKALLELAKTNGALLDSSWYPVLTTMQHFVWMLGLKAAPGTTTSAGGAKSSSMAAGPQNSAVPMLLDTSYFEGSTVPSIASPGGSTATKVLAELPQLSQNLSTVFEQSKNFDEIALGYLIRALCSVAMETFEVANSSRAPSHFSVVKLTEVGLSNLQRLDIWWNTISEQLLTMCKVVHPQLRQLSVDAVILLIERVITSTIPTTDFWNNGRLSQLVLEPLTKLTDIKFSDVQEKQLHCIQYLILHYGNEINGSWLRLINIVGSIVQSHCEKHIRSAFQCFQFVVRDYLPTLAPDCYLACVDTAAKFGHQDHDLNIALAAIGSLLHLTDFLFQRRSEEKAAAAAASAGQASEGSEAETLWVAVFGHLSALVRDRRPAVRKSAGQTLFNAIQCHSDHFAPATWHQLLWAVFFPLLSDVQDHCANAPMDRESRGGGASGSAVSGGGGGGNLLVHHSRDTAAKQWAETVVLALTGVARCFVAKQAQIIALDRFDEAWERLLANCERAVLTPNSEIAQNALSTLKILLDFDTTGSDKARATWLAFWNTWVSIGNQFVDSFAALTRPTDENSKGDVSQTTSSEARKMNPSTFGPEFFALYFDLFPPLYPRVEAAFEASFFAAFAGIASQGVLGPIYTTHFAAAAVNGGPGATARGGPGTPSFMATFTANMVDEQGLTQTQRSVFKCLSVFYKAIEDGETSSQDLLVPFLELLLRLSSYAVRIPRPSSKADLVEAIPMNYIIFSEKCLDMATQLYKAFAASEVLHSANGLLKMIETLHVPMAAKYKCQCRSTWLLASKCFMEAITVGVPIAVKRKTAPSKTPSNNDLWSMIYTTLRDFLFCQNQPVEPLSGEEFQQHEALDCKFIELICERFLSRPEGLPAKFIEQLVGILGLGSVEASLSPSDFTQLDPTTLRPAVPSTTAPPAGNQLQPFVHRSPSAAAAAAAVLGNGNGAFSPPPATVHEGNELRPFQSREHFMRRCFEALLMFAFVPAFAGSREVDGTPSPTLRMSPASVLCRTAVRDVLDRCRFILQRFAKSAQLTGKCPLPRAKLSEAHFAFQALALLLANFTAASAATTAIDSSTWSYVIDIYPLVVDCIFVAEASQLLPSIHKLLQLYGRLLQPKAAAAACGCGPNAETP